MDQYPQSKLREEQFATSSRLVVVRGVNIVVNNWSYEGETVYESAYTPMLECPLLSPSWCDT